MRASHMRIMPNISAKSAILILAALQPSNDLFSFLMAYRLLKCGKTGKGPIPSCNFKMFSEILANRIEIFTVVQSQQILRMFLLIKFDALIVHLLYITQTKMICIMQHLSHILERPLSFYWFRENYLKYILIKNFF